MDKVKLENLVVKVNRELANRKGKKTKPDAILIKNGITKDTFIEIGYIYSKKKVQFIYEGKKQEHNFTERVNDSNKHVMQGEPKELEIKVDRNNSEVVITVDDSIDKSDVIRENENIVSISVKGNEINIKCKNEDVLNKYLEYISVFQ